MRVKGTKPLLALMGSVQVIMLVLVFSPVFAERDSYKLARDMLSAVPRETGASEVAETPAEDVMNTWRAERLHRDLQVFVCAGLLAGLFINSFVLTSLIDKTLSDTPEIVGLSGRRRRWAFLDHPLTLVTSGIALTMIAAGAVGLTMAYKNPSPLGLWSVVTVVVGATALLVSIIWGMAAGADPTDA